VIKLFIALNTTTYPIDVNTCGAVRSKRSVITCEMPADHNGAHGGRGKRGQWFFWASPTEKRAQHAEADTR
jgi:hypothetical protein